MFLTGFADEAAPDMAGQIEATKALGWHHIESRNIDGTNIHDLDDVAFEVVCEQLDEAGVHINCFGSAIANWAKPITQPYENTLAEIKRAIPRMQRLGTEMVRIMSFAVLKEHGPEDQMLVALDAMIVCATSLDKPCETRYLRLSSMLRPATGSQEGLLKVRHSG